MSNVETAAVAETDTVATMGVKARTDTVATVIKMNTASLNRAITQFASSGKRADIQLHHLAIQCALHAREHGDIRLMTRLFHAIPASGRRLTFKNWCCEFFPVVFEKKEVDKVIVQHFKLRAEHSPKLFKIEEAAELPFWMWNPEKEAPVFNLEAAIKRLTSDVRWINNNVNKMPEAERGKAANLANHVLQYLPKDVQATLREKLGIA